MDVEKNKAMRIPRQPFSVPIMIDQKLLENVGYLNYLGGITSDNARCTQEVKSRISMIKSAFSKKKSLVTS
jgi:hypothetical protein